MVYLKVWTWSHVYVQVVLIASAKLREGNTSNGVENTNMNGESSQMQPTSMSRP